MVTVLRVLRLHQSLFAIPTNFIREARRTETGGTSKFRRYSTAPEISTRPQRSYLYVPSSSSRMLQKSTSSASDVLIYDLEDSVAPSQKEHARAELSRFITSTETLPDKERLSIRVNSIDTPFFDGDIALACELQVPTVVLPKVHSPEDLDVVSKTISQLPSSIRPNELVKFVASIESARALWSVGNIASWKSKESVARIVALLFAAEDFCADSSIIRTPSRLELLYPRSRIALAARTFHLQAIDMVCINYKDKEYLREECEDGRRLGFNGKQAIHPDQVDVIQSTFVPTEKEIRRAATILHQMKISHASSRGAFGLDLADGKGGKEMIDAPMLKQAEHTIRLARAAGLDIPDVE